ncbi:MAG: GNAT family N-acetyltransferase [Bacteroidales bacterium]|jgi:Acetyltransferase (GNAT) family.|nr:GNAT family N-acetyltransferase [Bacteroidales bacterium]HNT42146.1 GNAT family N-acetyltransferase [Tenuifilaceae bacterium]MBP8644222.1 GNAT family N-acetyltransferase [Bacteroidales bacterium]NLI86834.1 GNAT family N-acetyltransferase [Bacteroidales bacterium]HOA08669.1 GNAT family N-acetyltransferase [Tenuifilaceae bacterium]
MDNVTFRSTPTPADKAGIREILSSSGFFHDFEIDVAIELVEEALAKGTESGYYFVFADHMGTTISYACFGPIPCTRHSFDLYWIGTHQDYRGKGLGKQVLQRVENEIKQLNGRKIYIETSSKPMYEPTRQFYLSNAYENEAILKNFYDEGDDKVVYSKSL